VTQRLKYVNKYLSDIYIVTVKCKYSEIVFIFDYCIYIYILFLLETVVSNYSFILWCIFCAFEFPPRVGSGGNQYKHLLLMENIELLLDSSI